MKNLLPLAALALALAACGGTDIGPIVGSCDNGDGSCTDYGQGWTSSDLAFYCPGTPSSSPCSQNNLAGECVVKSGSRAYRINYSSPSFSPDQATAACRYYQQSSGTSLINPPFGDL